MFLESTRVCAVWGGPYESNEDGTNFVTETAHQGVQAEVGVNVLLILIGCLDLLSPCSLPSVLHTLIP